MLNRVEDIIIIISTTATAGPWLKRLYISPPSSQPRASLLLAALLQQQAFLSASTFVLPPRSALGSRFDLSVEEEEAAAPLPPAAAAAGRGPSLRTPTSIPCSRRRSSMPVPRKAVAVVTTPALTAVSPARMRSAAVTTNTLGRALVGERAQGQRARVLEQGVHAAFALDASK
eukprot:CAMPEP_0194706734 /NCGR_PEP_ID=MMETSP0295-20121207/29735_1 /TAXON_ID=39354 /ORGANISM="Heterosigma akashiwo, Strain CCMP2393" /LENGTH=172 /DNA_ID=CAMNT_0039602727 /DNA_START=310 /DNA_END=826 /DNA_ORIENTATION=+